MNKIIAFLILILLAPAAGAKPKRNYIRYSPPSGSFSVEIPEGWVPFEEESPRGTATHIIGPAEASGAWRASYHVHYFEKGKPGFLPAKAAMRVFRNRDKGIDREVGQMTTWRVDKKPAKMFQVREKRILPANRLPAERVSLHHFYMFLPAGRTEYYVIKLSTTEKTFLNYRAEFRRFMSTFKTR
ncbi:MAG: hypothetical protein COB53_05840 [Elusimicrobia bacterium]|nr:MAG: hypothetical protein COB53_05840 [Elusimicrobiota bacterium]